MPAITLLPAKIVNDLRIIADYLVKSPGDNHTGVCKDASLYVFIYMSSVHACAYY